MNMKQPPLIKFNLLERGREHTGNKRDFDIKALCDNINGERVQELVKNRDMLGFYGHQHRMLSTLEPAENSVINGVMNKVEPAIITTKIKAFMDGTIEHKTEFLESSAGESAYKMFKSKIGGFSSVIDEKINNFYGFDYVLSPNFTKNRGFTFDSINGQTFDSVYQLALEEKEQFLRELVEKQEQQISLLSASLDSASMDNEELLSMISRYKEDVNIEYEFKRPITYDGSSDIMQSVERFKNETRLIMPMREITAQPSEEFEDYLNFVKNA